jgi:hypothetical protein
MDQILSKNLNGPTVPSTAGLVARAVLEIPELQGRYDARVRELITNVFLLESITNRLNEVAAKITDALTEANPGAIASFRSESNKLIREFRQRAASLQRQIAPRAETQLVRLSPLKLTDWQPTTDLGEAELSRTVDQSGNSLLHISTSSGCTASWRTRVLLDRGSYRFEARLKTQGVVLNPDDPRAGAGLRVSRHRIGQKNTGDRDWLPASFDLEVRDEQTEVELICELRADQGAVSFDLNSLQIRRR